jgi:hypothetical protein
MLIAFFVLVLIPFLYLFYMLWRWILKGWISNSKVLTTLAILLSLILAAVILFLLFGLLIGSMGVC